MGKLTSMHFYGWRLGLKTGMYYLRTQAAAAAIVSSPLAPYGWLKPAHKERADISLVSVFVVD